VNPILMLEGEGVGLPRIDWTDPIWETDALFLCDRRCEWVSEGTEEEENSGMLGSGGSMMERRCCVGRGGRGGNLKRGLSSREMEERRVVVRRGD
jgi:hypothetical protein